MQREKREEVLQRAAKSPSTSAKCSVSILRCRLHLAFDGLAK